MEVEEVVDEESEHLENALTGGHFSSLEKTASVDFFVRSVRR